MRAADSDFERSMKMSISPKEGKDELARIQEATDYPVQRS